jgi:hypothetical protein
MDVATLSRTIWEFAAANPATVSAIAAGASAFVAITAIIISPLVSVRIASRQIRATVVSTNRQAWINALRDDLSELFELLTWSFLLRPGTHSGDEGFRYVAERRSRIRLLINRIRLRLNPSEGPSTILLNLINNMHDLANGAVAEEQEGFSDVMERAVAIAQDILKTEWNRVKKGK